jgi:hypothetical protein
VLLDEVGAQLIPFGSGLGQLSEAHEVETGGFPRGRRRGGLDVNGQVSDSGHDDSRPRRPRNPRVVGTSSGCKGQLDQAAADVFNHPTPTTVSGSRHTPSTVKNFAMEPCMDVT